MNAIDYTQIDAAIIKEISEGRGKAAIIVANTESLTKPTLTNNQLTYNGTFRVIDRRLQALKRNGSIVYTRAGWVIA